MSESIEHNSHEVELDTSAEREELEQQIEDNLQRLSWLEQQWHIWEHRA